MVNSCLQEFKSYPKRKSAAGEHNHDESLVVAMCSQPRTKMTSRELPRNMISVGDLKWDWYEYEHRRELGKLLFQLVLESRFPQCPTVPHTKSALSLGAWDPEER